MLKFKIPEISDKPAADAILFRPGIRSCDYCFGNLFIWRKYYGTQIAFDGGFLFVRAKMNGRVTYLFPAGDGDFKAAAESVFEDARNYGVEPGFSGLTPPMKEQLETLFPGMFEFRPVRANFDYIYRADDLIRLSGKKYHSKRNHVARFKNSGAWDYEDITAENIGVCRTMNDEWCRRNGCGQDAEKKAEYCAVSQAFDNFAALGFKGGLLRLEGSAVAFTMGEKIGPDTFAVHIEKAFSDAEGAYQAVNQEFAARRAADCAYINREDDVGMEGLRKAKLSYYPALLLEKYDALYRQST